MRIRGSWVALLWICGIAPASSTWGSEAPAGSGAAPPGLLHEWKLPPLAAIRLYQLLLSSQDAPSCPFYPSCSHFGQEATRQYGLQGMFMTADRLLRCNGFHLERYELDPRTGKHLDPPIRHVLWGPAAEPRRTGAELRMGGGWRRPGLLDQAEAEDETGEAGPAGDGAAARDSAAGGGWIPPGSATGGGLIPPDSAAGGGLIPPGSATGGGWIPPGSAAPGSLSSSERSGDRYYSPTGVKRFADYLYDEGDFLRAAGEYQRFLYLASSRRSAGDHLVTDSVALRIGVCFRQGGSPRLAAEQFRSMLGRASGPFPRCAALTELTGTYWDLGRPEAAVQEIDSLCQDTPPVCHECSAWILRGTSHLLAGSWRAAKGDLAQASASSGDDWPSKLGALRQIADDGCATPRKSAAKAAMLSALLPGAGRVYAGNAIDGIMSLGTIALMGWQAVSGFHDHGSHSLKGWIYGAFSLGFYGGNIYGSAMAARIHNRAADERLIQRTRGLIEERGP